jgi:hypothetical protein
MKVLHTLALIAVGFMGISNSAHADSVLVGTDLTTASGAGSLCPSFSNCEAVVQSFTFSSQVTITDIQVVMAHPNVTLGGTNGGFVVGLVDSPIAAFEGLPVNVTIGSGFMPYPGGDPNHPIEIYQLFDFSGLDITKGPGTYYLEFAGGAVGPARATTSLATTAGTLGKTLACDPTVELCNNLSSWFPISGPFAFTVNGTVATPEPSSWLLLATGIVGATGVSRHTFKRRCPAAKQSL